MKESGLVVQTLHESDLTLSFVDCIGFTGRSAFRCSCHSGIDSLRRRRSNAQRDLSLVAAKTLLAVQRPRPNKGSGTTSAPGSHRCGVQEPVAGMAAGAAWMAPVGGGVSVQSLELSVDS